MSNRTAIVASVLLTGCVSISIVMPSVAFAAPDAGSECLSAPKATTPAGGHWYYRLEKGTKRKCWYLGDAGGKVNKTAETAPVAEPDAPPPKKPLQKSVANARAELRAGSPANEDTSLSDSTWPPLTPAADESSHNDNQSAAVQPAPEQASPEGGNLSSRWPEPKSVASATDQPATSAPAPAQTTPALTPDRLVMAAATPAPAPAATSAPAVQPVAATAPAEDNFSIRILLSILVGVLALAAIVGPVIFRFIKPRRNKRDTVQRRPIWDMNTSGAILRQDDPRMAPPLAYVDPLPEPRVLDEAVDEIEHLLSRASRRSAA